MMNLEVYRSGRDLTSGWENQEKSVRIASLLAKNNAGSPEHKARMPSTQMWHLVRKLLKGFLQTGKTYNLTDQSTATESK